MKKQIFSLIIAIFGMLLFHSCRNKPTNHRAGYGGKDLSQIAFIEQDRHTKATTFSINTKNDWKLYAGNRVATIDFSKPLLEGKGNRSQTLLVPENRRVYFQLETDASQTLLAARRLPLEGACNFRDMGGIKTKDGRFVKWGKVFRSDDLLLLTANDLAYLTEIPIIYIVDFRSPEEIKKSPDRIPESARNNYHAFPITPGNLTAVSDDTVFDFSKLQKLNMDSIMIAINVQLVTDPEIIGVYRDFFDVLQNDLTPLLFHCTAGKDRTGMAAALFLFSLGVDEETVMQDYLLSNKYVKEKFAATLAHYPFFAPLAGVQVEYLQAGIDQIKKDHGSIENYLENSLNVDLEKMRNNYLY